MNKIVVQHACALTLCLFALSGCDDKASVAEDEIGQGSDRGLVSEETKNAEHPIAGRSAFPEADEDLTEPIPHQRLTAEEQFILTLGPDEIPDVVPWEQASQYVGYEITVEGPIVSVGQSRDGKINFLNFHQDWRGKFYMVLFDDLADTLEHSVESLFKGKTVRVTGKVELHRGRPQIKILSMDQIKVVDE